ncbi:hypothetical protein L873DRAFT_1382316 [Choiromyces venosus 120613-1]|uniref:Uncharacterized protein n=1 Tax=Choiromyces venosus 120613-1 TaxID=1336337 RepID=A0A3N4JM52_9PEZI|nr:hypothetical protein L873DRAFT_1382316 [Choiromyces venosus 120613-1]
MIGLRPISTAPTTFSPTYHISPQSPRNPRTIFTETAHLPPPTNHSNSPCKTPLVSRYSTSSQNT